MIEGKNIGFATPAQTVFKQVSFSIGRGEHVVLIGPSGHGKSVLLKILAGLMEITEGELYFENEKWSELSITQRTRHYLKRGMLFQKNALFDSLSVRENLLFPIREVFGPDAQEQEKKALEILSEVGLSHALDLFPHELSGGMQKRLGLARALALRPPILLADDPVAGLDPITSRQIIKLMKQLQAEFGTTCVSVLNDMNRAFELGSRLMIVMDQEVVDLGSHQAARQPKNPKHAKFLRGEP